MVKIGLLWPEYVKLLVKLLIVVGLLCPRNVVAECHCGACCTAQAEPTCPHCQADTDQPSEGSQPSPSPKTEKSKSSCCCDSQPQEQDEPQNQDDQPPAPPKTKSDQTDKQEREPATAKLVRGCCCQHGDQQRSALSLPCQRPQRLAESDSPELLVVIHPPTLWLSGQDVFYREIALPPLVYAVLFRALFCTWLE